MGPLEKMKRMLQDTESSADVESSLDTIERNAQRIQNLVNQILDVRKIDKQQMHLHCEETDLIDFSRSICKMFEYNAHERNINFTFNHGELDELRVWVDRSQFDKVITNLISNAFKYTFDGGSIELRLSASNRRDWRCATPDLGSTRTASSTSSNASIRAITLAACILTEQASV